MSSNTLISVLFFAAIMGGVYWFLNRDKTATKSGKKTAAKGVCPCSATQWQLNEDLLDEETGEVLLEKGDIINGQPVDGYIQTDDLEVPAQGCTPIG